MTLREYHGGLGGVKARCSDRILATPFAISRSMSVSGIRNFLRACSLYILRNNLALSRGLLVVGLLLSTLVPNVALEPRTLESRVATGSADALEIGREQQVPHRSFRPIRNDNDFEWVFQTGSE